MTPDPDLIDLLLIDDDTEFRSTVARRFLRRGYQVQEASDGAEGLELAEKRHFHVAVVDLMMPGMNGIQCLERLKQMDPECQVVMLTGQGSVETAVQAMKLGAFDYLAKPFPLTELEVLIQKAYDHGQLGKENQQLKAVLKQREPQTEMIGESAPMRELERLIARAGPTDSAILIQGESGTGKELVARALHRYSLRADKPLVTINCAALPETLLESELFGHEKGAFTGAVSAKPGLFEVADRGTLFIDEIGEMPGSLQAKLLRVLENGEMRRIGSLKERRVNVRLLAATNRSMQEEVRAGRFREDLYYRINVMSLELPPLRSRPGDIALLIKHFLDPDWKVLPEALTVMERYSWPGNVRQLANALARAKIMADHQTISLADLPHEITGGALVNGPATRNGAAPFNGNGGANGAGGANGNGGAMPGSSRGMYSANGNSGMLPDQGAGAPARREATDSLAMIERTHIVDILAREGGTKARAARALGINRRTLYRMLEKYEIHVAAPR